MLLSMNISTVLVSPSHVLSPSVKTLLLHCLSSPSHSLPTYPPEPLFCMNSLGLWHTFSAMYCIYTQLILLSQPETGGPIKPLVGPVCHCLSVWLCMCVSLWCESFDCSVYPCVRLWSCVSVSEKETQLTTGWRALLLCRTGLSEALGNTEGNDSQNDNLYLL